jgi:hypothetical protein
MTDSRWTPSPDEGEPRVPELPPTPKLPEPPQVQFERPKLPGSEQGKPNNFEAASQVVAIGSYKDGVFYAEDMLVKCPSKYQGETQTARN